MSQSRILVKYVDAEWVTIDGDEGVVIVDKEHQRAFEGKPVYRGSSGYAHVRFKLNGKWRLDGLHRYIMEAILGIVIPKGYVVHHKNGNRLDNRVCNLEVTTPSHNASCTDRKGTDSTSTYKGVYFCKIALKFIAQMSYDNKTRGIGSFDEEIEAARAYDKLFVAVHRSTTGSNGTLSDDEVLAILTDPESHMHRSRSERSKCPPFFIKIPCGKFRVRIRKHFIDNCFDTLEEAVAFRDTCFKEFEEEEQEKIRSRPIKRNAEGVAIVMVTVLKGTREVEALVDDDDYYDLMVMRWVLGKDGYPQWKTRSMHRVVMKDQLVDGKVVDHINGDRLDCRKANLRVVSYSLNNRNKRKKEGASSSYRGVHYSNADNLFHATIVIDGKKRRLGQFSNEEDARDKYLEEYRKIEAQEKGR